MRVYQPTYRDRATGQYRKQQKYWVEFRDHKRKLRRLPTYRYRSQAERFARNSDSLVRCRQTGSPLDAGLTQWLGEIPEATIRKLQQWDLLPPGPTVLSDPISVHLEDFEHSLIAKGRTVQHIRETVSAVRQTATPVASRIGEISASRAKLVLVTCGEASTVCPDVQSEAEGL